MTNSSQLQSILMFKKRNLAKLLNLILRQKDSITFVDGTLIQDSNLDVPSVDVDYLFINISLDKKTIDIYINKLFQNPETLVYGISKNAFRNFFCRQTILQTKHLKTFFLIYFAKNF